MTIRSRSRLLASLLAVSVMVAMAASTQAATSLQITFGSQPRWVGIPGTQIREIRQGDRTDYDMFRYGNMYYAYNNADNNWYASRKYRGRFMLVDNRSVPRELRRIPRNHWRNYPTAWRDDRDGDRRDYRGSNASFEVNFGGRNPRWSGIGGTRVEVISAGERPNYDVFRYGGNYYVYNSNRWYTSNRPNGTYMMIDDRSVPSEFSRVPRDQWRNYPTAWQDRDHVSTGTSATFQVNFGSSPQWMGIGGTRIETISMADRPNYDVFRYNGNYYVYNSNQWYTSSRASGQFTMMNDQDVPDEFSRVPREHWRNYPVSYGNNGRGNGRGRGN